MFSPKRWASSLDSSRVFPCSLVRIGAISSTFPSICRAALCRISARLAGASLDQLPNAFAAAFAALSTSAAPPAGTSSPTSPVAGVWTPYLFAGGALVPPLFIIIVSITTYFLGGPLFWGGREWVGWGWGKEGGAGVLGVA